MTAQTQEAPQVATRFFPSIPPDAAALNAPVTEVTVLEDRAQITRSATQTLTTGRQKLLLWEVSPVLQDVSLRASCDEDMAHIVDLRLRRSFRVKQEDQPEAIKEIDQKIREITDEYDQHTQTRRRLQARYRRLQQMLREGAREIPEDAAWGKANHQVWNDTFSLLFRRSRELLDKLVAAKHDQEKLKQSLHQLTTKREQLVQREQRFIACVEMDIDVHKAGEVALSIQYITPNAMWRPQHTAKLESDGHLHMTSNAVVWQHTGEDWTNAALSFSTARSSLGTEAPLLSEDLLQAQRKAEELRVEQREVSIQHTGPRATGGSGQPPAGVELPGVDDGGELQHLKAEGPVSVEANGLPHTIPLFSFRTKADTSYVCLPEQEAKVFLKSVQTNEASGPLLAGPVELLRDHGSVGWSQIMFVAPGEPFSLGFGPDDALRISRTQKQKETRDPIDLWHKTDTEIKLFLSNLGGEDKTIELQERLPVSEVEHVKITWDQEASSPSPSVDDNGFCHWNITIPGNQTKTITWVWQMAQSPEIVS